MLILYKCAFDGKYCYLLIDSRDSVFFMLQINSFYPEVSQNFTKYLNLTMENQSFSFHFHQIFLDTEHRIAQIGLKFVLYNFLLMLCYYG